MKSRIIGLIVALVMVMSVPAMAIDESACSRWPHGHWGDNVSCVGLLEYDDMFNPGGTIKASFQAIMDTAASHPNPANLIFSPLPPAADLVSEDVGTAVFNFQIDNRRFAGGREPDHRAKFVALQNAKRIPQVWALSVTDPFPLEPEQDFTCCHFDENGDPINFEHDNLFYLEDCPFGVQEDYGYVYPVTIYHFDTEITQDCIDQCETQGWWWEPGDGSPCDWCFSDSEGPGSLPNGYAGPTFRLIGDQVPQEDLTVTWGSETRGVGDREKETYWYKSWNTGNNYLSSGNGGPITELYAMSYMKPFSTPALIGTHTYEVKVGGAVVATFDQEVFSNRIMPVVSAVTEVLTVQTVKGNSKVKTKDLKSAVNVTAREVVDQAGEKVLIVQWTAPDEALKLSPYEKSVRLRIYVGNGWFPDEGQIDVDFAWIDAPLHTSSVVVPAEVYNWIKTTTLAKGINELDIAGMYREQFGGYHNRGYFEGVTFDLIQ